MAFLGPMVQRTFSPPGVTEKKEQTNLFLAEGALEKSVRLASFPGPVAPKDMVAGRSEPYFELMILVQAVPKNGRGDAMATKYPARGRSDVSSGSEHVRGGMTQVGLEEVSWQDLFSNPTQWWDNRGSKESPRHPDFRHKKSKKALWLNSWNKPAWVEPRLAMWDSQVPGWMRGSSGGEEQNEVEMCRKLCEDGRYTEAVEELGLLVQRACHIPNNLFYQVVKRCIEHKDLALGRRVHALTVESGYEGDAFLATHLIGLYASHGRLEEATRVFSQVSSPSAHNWASIIFAYVKHGEPTQAIRLYRQMLESTVKPDNRIFVAVLKACASAGDLAAGKDVHTHILASAGKPDVFVQNTLVDMYAKCGSLTDARRVFDRLPRRNVVTWTAMIAGYAQQGMGQEALSVFSSMQRENITPPDSVTFVCLLQACASVGLAGLHQGKQLHAQLQRLGEFQDDALLGASLVNMYSKCGSLDDARKLFDRLSHKSVSTWNAMIAGYAHQGTGQEAFSLYDIMRREGIASPNCVTFVCLLQACASVAALPLGKQLHVQIEEQGLQGDAVVGSSLISMYAKCGSIEDARRVFDKHCHKDVVMWNAMMAGYSQQEMGEEVLSLFSSMEQEGIIAPDSVTFVCLLQACASLGGASVHQGRLVHAQIEERGMQADMVVGASLVNMYAKCGSLEDARRVFDRLPRKDVVTWNAMIAGYAQQGMGREAFSLYHKMRQEASACPSCVTFVTLLQACAILGAPAMQQGKQLHAEITQLGLQVDVVVGGSLVNMYAKCGSLEDAEKVFDGMPNKSVVTWNALMAGYAQLGMGEAALGLYRSMLHEGLTPPNSATFVCALQACASLAALPLGKQLHAQIEEQGLQGDAAVGPSLINMYGKCGSLEDAQQVFDSLPERETVAWGALIAGYARQGDCEAVFDLVDRMRHEGIQANSITFLSVLTVCSHAGLVEQGRKYFEEMSTGDGSITPTLEHYTCMMDLLGRAGHLDEALVMVKSMPFQPDVAVWLTLLGACQKWRNVEVGRQAFEFAASLDEKDAGPYVLMYNIYAGAQMWEEAKEIQARRVRCGARKEPGQSWWLDMSGGVHTFVVGDR